MEEKVIIFKEENSPYYNVMVVVDKIQKHVDMNEYAKYAVPPGCAYWVYPRSQVPLEIPAVLWEITENPHGYGSNNMTERAIMSEHTRQILEMEEKNEYNNQFRQIQELSNTTNEEQDGNASQQNGLDNNQETGLSSNEQSME